MARNDDYNPHHKYVSIEVFERETGVHFTKNHNGKMEGMVSLSTSPLQNRFCQARAKNKKTICSHCYAITLSQMFPSLVRMLGNNLEILSSKVIPVEQFPVLNLRFFRFEAFGDLSCVTQYRNYVNLCLRNPGTQFALWTKNPQILAQAQRQGVVKPKNLTILVSSPLVNVEIDLAKIPLADKSFTVYTEGYAKEHGITINCGGRACLTCRRCYSRGGAKKIHELIKFGGVIKKA